MKLLNKMKLLSVPLFIFTFAISQLACAVTESPKSTKSEEIYSKREDMRIADSGDQDVEFGGQNETLEESFRNVTAQLGSSVFLECDTQHSLEREVTWVRRYDWHILTSGTTLYTKEDRFSLHHTEGGTTWTLEIKYVKPTDEGIYECQIATGKQILSELVNLRVIKPRASISGSGEYHIDRGSTIKLECVIEQTLKIPQFIFWYHNDRMINYDADRSRVVIDSEAPEIRSSLTVTDARPSDSGNYTCDAANTDAASAIVYVTEANNNPVIQTRSSSAKTSCASANLILVAFVGVYFNLKKKLHFEH